jgi:hypothetical protein
MQNAVSVRTIVVSDDRRMPNRSTLHATISCSAYRNGILNLYIVLIYGITISPLLYAKLFCSVVMALLYSEGFSIKPEIPAERVN